MIYFLIILLLGVAAPVKATDYYFDTVACSGNYSIENRTCTGTDGTSYSSTTTAVAALAAGDTLWFRSGTYDARLAIVGKTGTTSAHIAFKNYNSETVILQTATSTSYGLLISSSHYIDIDGLQFDGDLHADNQISTRIEGGSNITLTRVKNGNWKNKSVMVLDGVNGLTVSECEFYRSYSTAGATGTRGYGIYSSRATNLTIQNSIFRNNDGGGLQIYPGPNVNVTVRRNKFYQNNIRYTDVPTGGIVVAVDSTGANSSNIAVYDNLIYRNGTGVTGGTGTGIRTYASGGRTITDLTIHNNTIYGNASATSTAYGINIQSGTGVVVRNNVLLGNEAAVGNSGTSSVIAYNACGPSESCGTTGKVSISDATTVLVDPANDDFRLLTGSNTLRDAGTTVTTRSAPVGTPDMGAYEQGMVASATVASGFIEITMNVMTPGVLPTSNITGFTIANGTSTGTPVVSAASVKAGSNNVIQLTITGFTGTGTCTVTLGTTNITDSGYVGVTTSSTAQGVNTVSGQAVTGTCDNSAGGTPPAGNLHVHHKMNEGAGTSLADETINNLDSTTSGTPTWTTPVVEGAGLYFPNDGVDRRVDMAYGNAINATSQSFTFCVWVKPDAGVTGKLVMGTPNGTNMRMVIGWHSTTWGIGVGSSSYSSALSEFPVSPTLTRVCLINDAGTDTATLAVNGVKGTSAGAVKSSASVTALAGNFKIGCGILSTAYCGGFTVDEPKIWTSALSAAEILEDYNSYTPEGGSIACYKQQDSQQQGVYLATGSTVETRGSAGGTIRVVAGGGVAVVIQVDCTGSAGTAVALKPHYSKNGGAYSFNVPQTVGADGIAMWAENTSSGLNINTVEDCISGALTENYGPTITDSAALPTITLSQNHSFCVRYLFRVGSDQSGNTFDIRLYQDNGQPLNGGYTVTPRIEVIPMQAGGMGF